MRTPCVTISLRGPYSVDRLDRLLRAIAPLNAMTEPTRVAIDLSGLAHIDASSLAIFVATVYDVTMRGLLAEGSVYRPPKNFLVKRWLERMDVVRLLVRPVPRENVTRRSDQAFRPCQVFEKSEDLKWTADRLTGALTEACETDQPMRFATWFALNEIAENVIEHAESPMGAVALAQVSPKRREFTVSIADRGIGIRVSLRRNAAYADIPTDLEALGVAQQPGVTSKLGTRGGLGLFITLAVLKATGGSLFLRSGSAALETGNITRGVSDLVPMTGTLVALRFRTDRPFGLDVVLDALGITGRSTR